MIGLNSQVGSRNNSRYLNFAFLVLCLPFCLPLFCLAAMDDDDRPKFRPAKITPAVRQAALDQQEFAWELYQQLGRQPGNLFFSPISVGTAMSMVANGAQGETYQQIIDTLNIRQASEVYHPAVGELIQLLNTTDKGLQIRMINRIWSQEDLAIKPQFEASLINHYFAPLQPISFASAPEAARQEINAWVAKQTEDKIRDLFPDGTITFDTVMVLANAIYFKADWKTPFEPSQTRPQDFFLLDGNKKQISFMHHQGQYLYAENDDLQILSLPYQSQGISMIVALPRTKNGIQPLDEKVSANKINELIEKMKPTEVKIALPKFRFDSKFILNDILSQMGIQRAFTDQAEFERITSQERLKISVVVHQAFVDVDEHGTEAAAATGVGIVKTSMPVVPPSTPFVADRPFLFFIRHADSQAILFTGRFSDPP